jgi:hypothetical protein
MPSYLLNAFIPLLVSALSILPVQSASSAADPEPMYDVYITADFFDNGTGPASPSKCQDDAPDIQNYFVIELRARYAELMTQSGGYYYIVQQSHGVTITCTSIYAALTQLFVDDVTILMRYKYGGFGGCSNVQEDPTITINGPY